MKEYIERELLLIGVDGCISALHAQAKGDPIQEGAIKLVEATRDYIASLSAADVAPVVRCRECVHNHPEFVKNEAQWCELCRITINPDDFCSYGQKEEHTPTREKTHADAIKNACVRSKKTENETVLTKNDSKDEGLEANMDNDQFPGPGKMMDQQAKADAGKMEIDMVPTQIIRDIAEVRMYGNQKYHDSNNWKTVELRRYINAMLRHTLAFVDDPYGVDSESGIPHYKHAECNWSFISEILGGRVSKEAHNAQT